MGKRPSEATRIYRDFLHGKDGLFYNNIASQRQATIERMYRTLLTEVAINRFKWINLPDTVSPRLLEMTLYSSALSVFYYDLDFHRFLSLPGTPRGRIDFNGDPTAFGIIGNTMVNKTLGVKHCVPIWANYTRIPDTDTVSIYAHKLAEIDRTIEINAMNARQTRVLASTEEMRLSTENINRQIDDGQPTIRVNRGPNIGSSKLDEMVTAIDMGVDASAIETISIVGSREWNRCMTMLGIDNANQDKRERVQGAEVDANSEQVMNFRLTNLNARREAAAKINKMFGLNVEVEYNPDVMAQLSSAQDMSPLDSEYMKMLGGETDA